MSACLCSSRELTRCFAAGSEGGSSSPALARAAGAATRVMERRGTYSCCVTDSPAHDGQFQVRVTRSNTHTACAGPMAIRKEPQLLTEGFKPYRSMKPSPS